MEMRKYYILLYFNQKYFRHIDLKYNGKAGIKYLFFEKAGKKNQIHEKAGISFLRSVNHPEQNAPHEKRFWSMKIILTQYRG